jgi:hypothetical protein
VPRITDFCSCTYAFGCKLSLLRLCDSDFGITPVDDITIGITYYYYYCLSSRGEYRTRTGTAMRGRGGTLVPGSGKVKGVVFGDGVGVDGSGTNVYKSTPTDGEGST